MGGRGGGGASRGSSGGCQLECNVVQVRQRKREGLTLTARVVWGAEREGDRDVTALACCMQHGRAYAHCRDEEFRQR